MYDIEFRRSVEKIFFKMAKKNPKQLDIVLKKIDEIRSDPNRFKNLKRPLQHMKRVHVDKSFVLVFSVNESKNTVIIEDYDHHDNIYKR